MENETTDVPDTSAGVPRMFCFTKPSDVLFSQDTQLILFKTCDSSPSDVFVSSSVLAMKTIDFLERSAYVRKVILFCNVIFTKRHNISYKICFCILIQPLNTSVLISKNLFW